MIIFTQFGHSANSTKSAWLDISSATKSVMAQARHGNPLVQQRHISNVDPQKLPQSKLNSRETQSYNLLIVRLIVRKLRCAAGTDRISGIRRWTGATEMHKCALEWGPFTWVAAL